MNRTLTMLTLGTLVIAGCGKKTGKDGGGEGGPCEVKVDSVDKLVAGKSPQILAPFARLKLGMTDAEVEKACPNMFTDKGLAAKRADGTFNTGEMVGDVGKAGIYGRLDFVDHKLTEVSLDVPEAIGAALATAWSAPQKGAGSEPRDVWFDEASGLRATLAAPSSGKRDLAISAALPVKAFLERDAGALKIRAQDVLGKRPEVLVTTFPAFIRLKVESDASRATEAMMADMKKDMEAHGLDMSKKAPDVDIALPATPYTDRATTGGIVHYADDGTVRIYGVWLRAPGFPAVLADAAKTLDTLWGPHKTMKNMIGEESAVWYDAKAGIRVTADTSDADEMQLAFSRYLPLATFFGAPGALWGFEKADRPLLGATPDELKAAYGAAFALEDGGTTGKLELPPTDYDSDSSTTRFLLFIEGGKVVKWYVTFDTESNPGAAAELQAMFDAKLGTAAPGEDGMTYPGHPSVAVKLVDTLHQLEVTVSQ